MNEKSFFWKSYGGAGVVRTSVVGTIVVGTIVVGTIVVGAIVAVSGGQKFKLKILNLKF